MSKKLKRDSDDWVPTASELAEFRPLAELDSELLAAHKKGAVKKRGRPRMPNKKQTISLRLDPEILSALKARGKGWQTHLNAFLRSAVERHRI